jgi:hypothetical protein
MNLFKRRTTKRDAHAAAGCGCGSRQAHSEISDLGAPTGEGCCSNRDDEAKDRQPPAAEPGPASHRPHRGCCGEHVETTHGGNAAPSRQKL